MKWTIAYLKKNVTSNNEFDLNLDLSSYIEDTDIVKISDVLVVGDYEIYDDVDFSFYFDVSCTITMNCAITLEEVDVLIKFEVEELLSTEKKEDYLLIDGITVDISSLIWSNILLEKPYRVVKEGASFEESDDEPTKTMNNVFSNIEDFKE